MSPREISQSPPDFVWYPPRQTPQCVLLVCEKFAENTEFRVGNFAVNLKREISHAKIKCHENPPPLYSTRFASKARAKEGLPPPPPPSMQGVQ